MQYRSSAWRTNSAWRSGSLYSAITRIGSSRVSFSSRTALTARIAASPRLTMARRTKGRCAAGTPSLCDRPHALVQAFAGRTPPVGPDATRRLSGSRYAGGHETPRRTGRPRRGRRARRGARQALDQGRVAAAGDPARGLDGRPDDARGPGHARQGHPARGQGRVPGPDPSGDALVRGAVRVPVAGPRGLPGD